MPDAESDDLIDWLKSRSMLKQADTLAHRLSGLADQWRHPYGESQFRKAAGCAPVWLTVYPASIVTRPGQSVLKTLSDPALWTALQTIGIRAIHIGPTKLAGVVPQGDPRHQPLGASVDGHFDRIAVEIDPAFGSQEEFLDLVRNAEAHGAKVIDDIVPAHTGKGYDFRLAERKVGDYPGLYTMIEVPPQYWRGEPSDPELPWLPGVPEGADAVNLDRDLVIRLHKVLDFPGPLERTIFEDGVVKKSDWSATAPVKGADGKVRRWIYLHYFKQDQPSLNWLDPSFAAPRLVLGDALHSLLELKARILRLDANGFLGVESRGKGPDDRAWSEGHPLAATANRIIGGLVRKAGGFTFQELNLTVDDIYEMSQGGADLSYDFITRPACQHALVTANTTFLRLMYRITKNVSFGDEDAPREKRGRRIQVGSLVHALQNHDEMTLELVHFQKHAADRFPTMGGSGKKVRNKVRGEMFRRLCGEQAPYNLPFPLGGTDLNVKNGVACTTVSLIAAALGLSNLDALTPDDVDRIRRAHLLLVMFNALQPGVFAMSAWDLVGALPLDYRDPEVAARLQPLWGEDHDSRWIHRGGFDLMGVAPEATETAQGVPVARSLYGSLPEQLAQGNETSFVRHVRRILEARDRHALHEATLYKIHSLENRALFVIENRLSDGQTPQFTLLNFRRDKAVQVTVPLENVRSGYLEDIIFPGESLPLDPDGNLTVTLGPHEGRAYRLLPATPTSPSV
jgi:trehalose synthase